MSNVREEVSIPHGPKMDVVHDYIRQVKIALAVAVIRGKPDGSTAKHYAQVLCSGYRGTQLDCSRKCQQLEEEVLYLKQQLLLKNLPKELLDEPIDQEYAQYTDYSDCDLPDVLTPPSSDSDSPPSDEEKSSEKPSFRVLADDPETDTSQDGLNKRAMFISCLKILRSTARAGPRHQSNWDETVVATTLRSVENISNLFRTNEYLHISSPLLQTCVDCLVELVDSKVLPVEDHKKLLDICGNFLHVLATKIVTHEEMDCDEHQDQLCQYLLFLGLSDQLKYGIVRLLTLTILSFTDELRIAIKNPHDKVLEPHASENMHYIFWCLEQMLQKEMACASEDTLIPEELASQVQSNLDDAVLFISDDYPMFVHYIWSISDLIQQHRTSNPCQQNKQNPKQNWGFKQF